MSHATHADPSWAGPLLAAGLAVALYLAAAYGRPGARPWPRWRAASWAAGALLVAAAFAPAVAAHAHHDLRAHMAQHLLVGMLGPLGLALGAPVTLALRALPPRLGRRAIAALHSPPLRLVGHPLAAALLSVGGLYLLYFTPLYRLSLGSPALHLAVHAHVLAAGYLFTWAVLGQEPAARPAPWRTRLVALLLAGGAHAALPKLMFAYGLPAGLAHGADLLPAAQLMYYGGDVAEALLAICLFAQWYRRAGRGQPAAATRSAAP